jgi:hypothetical protein
MSLAAIFGCGPAGLLAAHACRMAGWNIDIISQKEKSYIPGSQYLHEPIPGITDIYPENHVQYIRMGTSEGYALKVYGDPARPTGWQNYNNVYPSWNVYTAYDKLWDMYSEFIVDHKLDQGDFQEFEDLLNQGNLDLVISTIPGPAMCKDDSHRFEGSTYWIKPLATPPLDAGRDIVIYNGLLDDRWYRWSILGGHCSVESILPMEDAIQGTKAISNDCDCWPTFLRAGRWAQWQHGILLNHAFKRVQATLDPEGDYAITRF